MNYWKVSY